MQNKFLQYMYTNHAAWVACLYTYTCLVFTRRIGVEPAMSRHLYSTETGFSRQVAHHRRFICKCNSEVAYHRRLAAHQSGCSQRTVLILYAPICTTLISIFFLTERTGRVFIGRYTRFDDKQDIEEHRRLCEITPQIPDRLGGITRKKQTY